MPPLSSPASQLSSRADGLVATVAQIQFWNNMARKHLLFNRKCTPAPLTSRLQTQPFPRTSLNLPTTAYATTSPTLNCPTSSCQPLPTQPPLSTLPICRASQSYSAIPALAPQVKWSRHPGTISQVPAAAPHKPALFATITSSSPSLESHTFSG